MIKVILRLDCGPGMEFAEPYLVSEEDWAIHTNPQSGVSLDYLADYAWDSAVEFAGSYGIYPESDRGVDVDGDDGYENYSEDIGGWFELYDPVEHDGLMPGYQREWDWKEL